MDAMGMRSAVTTSRCLEAPIGAFDCLHSASGGRVFSEQMQRAVQASYGTAGPAFIEKLMPNLVHRDHLRRFIDRF